MASLAFQKEAASILYAVLGKNASSAVYDSVGAQLQSGSLTGGAYVASLIASTDGQALYGGQTDINILQTIYTKVYGSAATTTVLQNILTASGSLASAVDSVISSLASYHGFDARL